MERKPQYTTQLGILLEAHRNGDESARNKILEHACERLGVLTSRMLRRKPQVKRWAETGDVLQEALLRLQRALESEKPEDARRFAGLASLQIRRELIDLARRFRGPQGIGHNHQTDQAEGPSRVERETGKVEEPEDLEAWEHFHEAVEKLSDDQREVTDLIWYSGMTQEEVAAEIGVSLKTVKRRWQSARLRLGEVWKKG
jgi:RNA polymerase sigma-70 factor (ECF subfamily)